MTIRRVLTSLVLMTGLTALAPLSAFADDHHPVHHVHHVVCHTAHHHRVCH